jgi:phage gp16-like protein
MARSLNTERIRLTRLVHVARRELAMDDDAWRQLLRDRFKVESSADLSIDGLDRLMQHLKSCGFKVRPNPKKKLPTPHKGLALTKKDIEAKIACQLKALGKEWPYAHGVARRIFPEVEKFEFLTEEQLGKVSSALERTIRFRQKQGA